MSATDATISAPESLSRQTAHSAMWLVGARVWSQVMSLTIGVALARLLSPSDYGLLGMVTVVTVFFGMLSDLGLSTAVIQKQGLTDAQLSSVFWFNIGVSSVISALLAAGSPLLAAFYSQPRVVSVMCVLSLSLPISALNAVQNALMQKQLRFRALTKINMGSSLVAGLLALTAAFAGWNVWALVLQQLLTAAFGTLGLWWVARWRPKLHFAWKDLETIWGFSLNLTGFQFVNYFARNADIFLIGRFLGATQLGFYNLACVVMKYPISNLISVAQGVLMPAFSQIQTETQRIANAYIKSCRYLAFLILPAMSGLALVAHEAVLTVYGPQWDTAGRVLQILCWVGTFQPFCSLAGVLVVARGFTRWFFWWGLIVSTITVAGFVIGLHWGIVGMASCYLITQVLVTLIGMPIQFRKVDVPVGKLLRSLSIPALGSVCMVCAVLFTKWLLASWQMNAPGLLLVITVSVGGCCYGFILFLLKHYFWQELRADLSKAFQLRRQSAASGQ